MAGVPDVRRKQILIRPFAETAVKIGIYAREHGMSCTAAACRLLDEHPLIAAIQLDEEGKRAVQEIVDRNTEDRRRKKNHMLSVWREKQWCE